MLLDVLDRLTDGLDLLGILVRDADVELFLELLNRHPELIEGTEPGPLENLLGLSRHIHGPQNRAPGFELRGGACQSFEIALTEVLESAESLASDEISFRASDFGEA